VGRDAAVQNFQLCASSLFIAFCHVLSPKKKNFSYYSQGVLTSKYLKQKVTKKFKKEKSFSPIYKLKVKS
jgi:hypothetical protein